MTKTHIIAPWTVYAYEHYYPEGGSRDAIAVFATEREAFAHAQAWVHVTDNDNIYICHPAGPMAPVPLPVITIRGHVEPSLAMIAFMHKNGTLPTIYLSEQTGQANAPMKSVFTHNIPGLPLRATYTLIHTQTIDDGVPTLHRGDAITCSIHHTCPDTGRIINHTPTATVELRAGRQDILRQALSNAIQQYPDITEHTRVSFLASIPTMDIEDIFTFLPATYTLD